MTGLDVRMSLQGGAFNRVWKLPALAFCSAFAVSAGGCASDSTPHSSTADAVVAPLAQNPGSARIAALKKLFPVSASQSDGDEEQQATSMLFWNSEQRELGFQSVGIMLPTRPLSASAEPYELQLGADERIAALEYDVAGKKYAVADFMVDQNMGGVLVLQGNEIRFEDYGLENTADSLWVSFSVAKSVTSLLIGAALRDGYIESLDEPITAYLPRMKGSAYDKSSIRDLLQMASGVDWNEDYEDAQSDVSRAGGVDGIELQNYLSALPRKHGPGETFNYSTGETNLAGALLRAAIGNNLASYTTTKIWQGFGMESDANWLLNGPDGTELGGCCISATLRDYGRIGRFVLAERAGRGEDSVLPPGWIAESTAPSKGFDGYGYFWWLFDDGAFGALGIFGQSIFIDPERDLVIVTHGSTTKAVSDDFSAHRVALFNAIRGLYQQRL